MPKKQPFTTTLRKIEAINPCLDGYYENLLILKSRPVPDGSYDDEYQIACYGLPKKSRYGPDDPIDLAEVAPKLWGAAGWLIDRILPDDLARRAEERVQAIEEGAALAALIEVLGPPKKSTPRKKK